MDVIVSLRWRKGQSMRILLLLMVFISLSIFPREDVIAQDDGSSIMVIQFPHDDAIAFQIVQVQLA